MTCNEPVLRLRDQDGELTLGRADLLNYTTRANVIAAALMIRVCHLAFHLLSPGKAVERRQLYWQLGFPGAGLVDCVEMISHAVREGRCLQQPVCDHHEAPFSVNGQFVFKISYQGQTITVWPNKKVFDDEFREQVRRWQDAPASAERDAFLEYKERKVGQIMSLSDAELLHYELQ